MTAAKSQQSESCVVGDKKMFDQALVQGSNTGKKDGLIKRKQCRTYFATVLLNSLKSVIIGTWYIVYNNCRHMTVTRKKHNA